MASSRRLSRVSMSIEEPTPRGPWVTWLALAIGLVLIIMRLTTPEALREPWAPVPGSAPTPAGPGPAVGLVLDALAYLPALLILGRRVFDRSYRLTPRLSHVPLLLLVVWASFSVIWSADKFAAVVEASHLCAAAAMLWAMSQLLADGGKLRLVAGICFGMLLILATQLLLFRYLDVPSDVQYWNSNKAQILKEHHWQADSFLAQQLQHKLLSGEAVSFYTSPNTLAAVGVILLAVSGAAGMQRVRDGDGPGWWTLTGVAIVAAIWVLICGQSKTSIATPILGALALVAMALWRKPLRRHSVRAYWAGIGIAIAGAFALVIYGILHHGLFQGHFSNSLDFRWKYWVASMKLVALHPLLGVGYANFGSHYLSVRLPSAVEEIQDPHNLFVHFATETGLIGLVLLLAWLGRLAWELTRPVDDQTTHEQAAPVAVPMFAVAAIAVVGIVGTTLVNVNFSQGLADVSLELMRRLLFGLVLVAGSMVVAMRSPHQTTVDNRPAPWIYYGIVIALALMLIHNLIDFSFFEPGPMLMTLLLCGVGLSAAARETSVDAPPRRGLAVLGLAVAIFGWIAFVLTIVGPVVGAEQEAAVGDNAVRANQPRIAAQDMRETFFTIPYNADYAERAATGYMQAGYPWLAMEMVDRAIKTDPMLVSALQLRVEIELTKPSPSAKQVIADFDRIVAINPDEVQLRIQFGQALDRLGKPRMAAKQYRRALSANAALDPKEPRRLSADELADLEKAIDRDEH